MKICIKCGGKNTRPTRLCNKCYNNQPIQLEKRRERDKRYYKKLSDNWKELRSNLICKRCGKSFIGKKRNQKYCSTDCRLDVKTKKPRGEINCVVCNILFNQTHRTSKCCSKKCIRKLEYIRRDKDKKRFYERTRDGRIRASGGSFSWEEWQDMKKKYKNTCPCCKKAEPEINLTIDHIQPISKEGGHYKENIQPLCLKCNIKKNNHYTKKYECPN